MLKVNNRNIRKRGELCSKLTLIKPESSGVFIANFEHISQLFQVFLLLTLNRSILAAISVKNYDITNNHVIMRFSKTLLDSPAESSEDRITGLLQRKNGIEYMHPANIYLFNTKNRNIRKRCEICSKLTIKTPDRRLWHCSGIFIINFECILHFFQVFLLLTLTK